MPAFVFFLIMAAAVSGLLIAIFRHNGQGPNRGGWWGGWGRDKSPKLPPSRPKPSGPDRDPELLYYPDQWDEYIGKWAKKIVRDSRDVIKVGR